MTKVKDRNTPQIEKVYLYMVERNGYQMVGSFIGPDGNHYPLMCFDEYMLADFAQLAQEAADSSGETLQFYVFDQAKLIQSVNPQSVISQPPI
jgi:hypothetical protein